MLAECWILDVGQGAAQVLLLPNGNAIIIDCATAGGVEVLLEFLDRRLSGDIEALVLSHSHADHSAGLAKLLNAYGPRTKSLFLVQDRDLKSSALLSAILTAQRDKRLAIEPQRLEAQAPVPTRIFIDPRTRLEVSVLAPRFQNALAHFGNPNALSGILLLRPDRVPMGPGSVILGGDAEQATWESLYDAIGKKTIECDVLVVPHHAGPQPDPALLYGTIIKSKYGVISVGTDNSYGHPNKPVIDALVRMGACVMCTQITAPNPSKPQAPGCCESTAPLGVGVLTSEIPSRSWMHAHRKTEKGLPVKGSERNVACAGTVVVEMEDSTAQIRQLAQHRQAIEDRKRQGLIKPLCLK